MWIVVYCIFKGKMKSLYMRSTDNLFPRPTVGSVCGCGIHKWDSCVYLYGKATLSDLLVPIYDWSLLPPLLVIFMTVSWAASIRTDVTPPWRQNISLGHHYGFSGERNQVCPLDTGGCTPFLSISETSHLLLLLQVLPPAKSSCKEKEGSVVPHSAACHPMSRNHLLQPSRPPMPAQHVSIPSRHREEDVPLTSIPKFQSISQPQVNCFPRMTGKRNVNFLQKNAPHQQDFIFLGLRLSMIIPFTGELQYTSVIVFNDNTINHSWNISSYANWSQH